MKTLKFFGLILILCFINTLIAKEKIDREFSAQKGGELVLSFKSIGGEIEITGWDQDRVKIEGEMSGSDWDEDCKLEFKERNGLLRIVPYCGYDDSWIKADLKIFVPVKFDLSVNSAANTHISNIEGELELRVGNANVKVEKFVGKMSFGTANGKVTIVDSDIDGDLSNVNGRLTLKNTNVRGKISTVNSGIDLHSADSGIEVSCVNGIIKIGSAKDFVKAKTTNAGVEISELDGRLQVETLNGHVIVNMVGDTDKGDHDIDLETMNGDVEIFLPDNFSMDVDIEIRKDYDGRNRKKYHEKFKIVSDFAIETEEKIRRGEVEVFGRGIVRGGKNRVRIRATNGDVFLLKSS